MLTPCALCVCAAGSAPRSSAIADHCFSHYNGVLRVDGEVGDKKAYDPRTYLARAEEAMANRVKRAATDLRSAGMAMVKP